MAKSKYQRLLFLLIVVQSISLLQSCNKDEVLYDGTNSGNGDDGQTVPVIILDRETGIYNTKTGRELIITPTFLNVADQNIRWEENSVVISYGPVFIHTWDEPESHYITIVASNAAGTISEEIRIDVGMLMPPVISLPVEGDVVYVQTGSLFKITAEVSGPDGNVDTKVWWESEGVTLAEGYEFSYTPGSIGDTPICVTAVNEDGSDTRSFILRAVDEMPQSLYFPSMSYNITSTDRYTFAGRGVYLKPVCVNLDGSKFDWTVNGEAVENNKSHYLFTPYAAGEYTVGVTVDGRALATVKVICVNTDEESRRRKVSSPRAACNKVFEYIPAPGQFIGESQSGGMTGLETTIELAAKWAQNRIDSRNFVSLGAWGGYIIVGFDHSVPAGSGAYDFAIEGNAFFNAGTNKGGSHEPGIVYVMQDVNGNGLPDDEWYELRGSETGKTTTYQDYAVTYYRPSGPGMNVQWVDNYGQSGTVDYLKSFHRQDYYYPSWIEADSYTLRGTRIAAQTVQNSSTGMWDNNAYAWGYADNIGSDNLGSEDAEQGMGQRTGFRISNAMYPDGTAVNLKYVDFIKVQTGVQSKAGWLGEVSTEVFGFTDLSIK